MPADRRLPLWAGRTAALLGILLIALNLRSAVAALSPIVDQIANDVALGPVVLGIIGAAPPVTFAVTGLLAPWLSRKLGLEGGLLLAAAAMVVGHVARSLAPNSTMLIIATTVTLAGAGFGNVLLPPVVKRYFPDRLTQVTTLYAVLIAVSTALPALAAVPVATRFGWRSSLAVWAVLALTALTPWVIATVRHRRELARLRQSDETQGVESEPQLEGRLVHSLIAWAVTVTFSISSINVYAAFAWMPTMLVDIAHVSRVEAGDLLSLYAFVGLPAALVVPLLASRLKNIGVLLYVAFACFLIGYGGLILAPAAAPILWVVIVGIGPMLFPVALVLINARTRTHAGSVALSGFVQGVGYIIAAVSPLVFGILHEATGSWTPSIVFLLVLSLPAIPAGLILAKSRYLEDDLGRQRGGAT
ncbi:MAG: transporter permease [Glaciihabitans sp.]|nr:transporter permease [Glaciihabitans sp.]